MRSTNPLIVGLLASSAACLLAAAHSGVELRERAAATARFHLWQAWLPPAVPFEPVADVVPAIFDQEAATAEPAKPRKLRRSIVPRLVEARATRNEIKPEDALRLALRSKRASFEHCYQRELRKQASFDGFLVIALTLSAAGRVTEARVQEGNRRDSVVGACIVAQLRTIRLPPLTSEAELLLPVRLQAVEPS